ncbi:MAG: hypothetical protein AB8I08_32500 [Sandaracinaceae bacterium]
MRTLVSGVSCPFCGARQDLSSTAFIEAKQYRADVFQQMRQADAERRKVNAWGQWGTPSAPNVKLLWGAILLSTVGPVCLSLPALLLQALSSSHSLHASGDALVGLGTTLGALVPVGLLVLLGIYLHRDLRTKPQPRSAAGPRPPLAPAREAGPMKVACPHCGAPNTLRVGETARTCQHCRGALMPSKTLMFQGLDAARAMAREAKLERHRAERNGMLQVRAYQDATRTYLPLFYGVTFFAPALGVFVLPFSLLDDDAPLAAKAGIGMVVVGAVGLCCALVAAFALRWHRGQKAWRRTLADLATQFHGHASTHLSDMVDWLNATWAGAYDLARIAAGPRFGFVPLDAWGFRAALVLSPTAGFFSGGSHARVVVAAWVPGFSDGAGAPASLTPQATATLDWLRGEGFDVAREEGGLVATATPRVLQLLRRHPESAHQLAPVIGHLVRLAHEIGARPV